MKTYTGLDIYEHELMNDVFVRAEEIKEWFDSQRQMPNDLFTIERLIDKLNRELSQSSLDNLLKKK